MAGIALIVFVALYFVKAGYGMFRTPSWGWAVDNKLAWVLMESPVFVVMLVLWLCSGTGFALPQFVFLFLFFSLFPTFVCISFPDERQKPYAGGYYGNGYGVQRVEWSDAGRRSVLVQRKCAYGYRRRLLLEPHAWLGLSLFVIGMGINLHSDHVIRHLRKPGDTRHYLPQKGMYRYVTSANYFGELVEWTGFAILTVSPAAWVFVGWTAANLVPRADAIHRKYREEFGVEAVGNRKRIIPFIY